MVPPDGGSPGEGPADGGQAAAWPVITEEEWQAIFRRTVAVRGPTAEPQRLPMDPGEQVPDVAIGRAEPDGAESPAAELDSLDLQTMDPEDTASPGLAQDPFKPATRGTPPPPALTEQEWKDRFFQRGSLTGLAEGEDLLILTAPDVVAGVTSIRLQGDALAAVAAAALRQGPLGLHLQDHDDLVLLATVLEGYRRRIPVDGGGTADQHAIAEVMQRLPGLIARVGALLPPR